MGPLQAVALVVVGAAGTATVLVRDPLRQAIVAGIFGFTLAVLFLVFSAPDVALSELTVASVAVPVMVILTLVKLREARHDRDESDK
jgi:energy-converting hydrogenase B subunit D